MIAEFEKLANEFQGLGLLLKQELDRTRKSINDSTMSAEQKDEFLKKLEAIEKSIANPEGGFTEILKAIKDLNDQNSK